MADKKHVLDWMAMGVSLISLAISGLTAYRTVLFQRDDIRFVVDHSLTITRDKTDFRLDENQEFTFINSGNRQAVISGLWGQLVLVTDPSAECNNRFFKSIFLDANSIVLKPGDIQPLQARVLQEYPWKKEKDGLHFREDKAEAGSKYLVCVEFFVTTPDSSSVRWARPLYALPADNGSFQTPSQLFRKGEPIEVLQRSRLGP